MMRLAAYALILSALYAALAAVDHALAEDLVVAFIAAIVVPAIYAERRSWQGRRS